jgi:protein-tyrosine phosphatase
LAHVLFVCTANQCRSPMAEVLFKQLLEIKGQGQGWQVGSAGIWAVEGAPATDLSRRAMRQRGLELNHHRSRPVSGEMLSQVDLILVMEARHRNFLKSEFPEFAERVHLISDMTGEGHEIKDPVLGTMETYRATADELANILDRGFERILELTGKNGVEKV